MSLGPLRALSFRQGLDTLLQEGFEGIDYISQEEVLSLIGEVYIFAFSFFKAKAPNVTQVNPEMVSGNVNTNPEYGVDTRFPFGFPVSASGWSVRPRRKRDEALADYFYQSFLLVTAIREGLKPPTAARIELNEKLAARLRKQVEQVERSTTKASESGQAMTLSTLEQELLNAFPQMRVREGGSHEVKQNKQPPRHLNRGSGKNRTHRRGKKKKAPNRR